MISILWALLLSLVLVGGLAGAYYFCLKAMDTPNISHLKKWSFLILAVVLAGGQFILCVAAVPYAAKDSMDLLFQIIGLMGGIFFWTFLFARFLKKYL